MPEYSIPKIFYSYETGEPFNHCIECEKSLHDKEYVVEKCFRNHASYQVKETVFDYAICMDCAKEIRSKFSQQSKAAIDRYFFENINRKIRHESSDSLEYCLVKNIRVAETSAYQIYAHCQGNSLIHGISPYAISELVMEEIIPLISSSTNDMLNGFFNKHFSPDPALFQPTPKWLLV